MNIGKASRHPQLFELPFQNSAQTSRAEIEGEEGEGGAGGEENPPWKLMICFRLSPNDLNSFSAAQLI